MSLQNKSIYFKEGYYAYKSNPYSYQNPYPDETYEFLDYRDGWAEAEFEDKTANDFWEGFDGWWD